MKRFARSASPPGADFNRLLGLKRRVSLKDLRKAHAIYSRTGVTFTVGDRYFDPQFVSAFLDRSFSTKAKVAKANIERTVKHRYELIRRCRQTNVDVARCSRR